MQPINTDNDQLQLANPLDNVADGITNQLIQSNADTETVVTNKSVFFNFVFTLFEEISKLHIKSFTFYFLQGIIVFIHMVGANWYCYLPDVWDKSTIFGQIVIGINSVLMLGGTNNPTSTPLPLILIPFFWFFLIALLFFAIFGIIKNSGTVNQYLVYFAAFVFQVLLVIGYLPAFAAFGSTFKFLLERDSVSIVFFILYIIIIGFAITALYFMSRLLNYCTNPTISPFTTYTGNHISNLLLFTGITIVLTNMSKLFQKWFYIVAIIVHVIFICYQFYDLFGFPMVKLWMMPLLGAFYTASIVTDVLTLISLFSDVLIQLIRFVVPIGVFVVAYVVFYFVIRAQIRSIAAILDPEDVPDIEKLSYFENMSCKNVRQAAIYVHVGLSQLKPVVLDGSLSLILARRFKSYEFWMLTANIAAFIPCNKPQLNEAISKLKSMFSKSMISRLLLQRLVKLEQSRALVSTNDINNKISTIKVRTDEAVNSVKQFWYEVANKDERATASSINSIAAIIGNSRRAWEEMLAMYPNEPRLAAEYSNFLIECLGKFELGIIWKLKSGHLEKGFHAGIDKLFQAFVVSNPRVWYDHMVDRLGNLSQGVPIDVTTHTTTATTTAQDKLEEDLEVGMLDQVAVQMFQWPRLRMNLTRATSHYRPKGLSLFRILKYIAFLVWIVLLIVTTIFYSTTFENITITYKRMESLITIRLALDNLRTLIFMNYAKTKNILYTEEEYRKALPASALEEDDNEFNYINFTDSFKSWSTSTLDSFIEMYQTFADSGLDGENVTRIVVTFLNETIPRARMQSNGETVMTSCKNAIISLLWNYEGYSNMDNPTYSEFVNSTTLYETAVLHQEFSLQSDKVLEDFAIQAAENSEDIQSFVKMLIIIVLVLTIAVCLPLMFVPLVIISVETNRIFKALKSVNVEGAKSASQQLSNSSEQMIDFSAAQNINSTSGTIIAMCILYGFLFFAAIVLASVAYTVLKSKGSYVADLIDLSRFGSARDPLASEIFNYVLMQTIVRQENQADILKSLYPDISTAYGKAIKLLTDYHSSFFRGHDGKEGVYTISSKIRDFHNEDKCGTDLTKGEMHPFYSCIALDRLIPTFLLYASYFYSKTPTEGAALPNLKSVNFVNLQHVTTAELYRQLGESRRLMSELINDSKKSAEAIAIILLVISLVIVFVNILIDLRLEQTLMKSLKTTLILLRHLPPPVVAETPELIDILLVKKSEETEEVFDPKQIIFNTTQTPIICIGDGFIIETINKSFRRAFNFSNEQLVGRKLTSLIEEPHEHEGDKSIEEQGAFRMYEKMRLMLEHDEDLQCNYPIQCICGDEEAVNTTVNVFPVHDKANHISNFVLLIEDRRESSEIEAKLESAKKESAMLMSQLIPREAEAFLSDKEEDFAFAAKNTTVLTVQIVEALELLNESNDRLDELFASIENIARGHPPFIKVKTLYDTLFFVGGLFCDDNIHANVAFDFAMDVKKELSTELPEKDGKPRFEIAIISGGPLICGLEGDKHKSFEVIGQLLDEAIELQAAAPPDSIIMTESTKELLADQNIDGMTSGSIVLQQKTYIL